MMDLQYTNDGFFDVLPQLALDGNNKVLKTIDNFVTIFSERYKTEKIAFCI